MVVTSYSQRAGPLSERDSTSTAAEVRKSWAELSSKVNELPDLKKLRDDLEKAQQSYTEAFEAAMKKEDAELFEKYRALREEEMERFNQNRVRAAPAAASSGYNQLSEEEKKQVYELRKQAMNAPTVKDAREKRNAATTDEARKAAESEYKAALRKAMLESDEKLAPLLDKLDGKSNPSPSPASSPAASK